MEHLNGLTNVCLSGGAPGADVEWGRQATLLGHSVIHWSFPTHTACRAPPSTAIQLSDTQLFLGTPAVREAAVTMGVSPPSRKAIWRLIHRNYYQVAWSESCYAVTAIRDEPGAPPPGGTAWTTTMWAQLHPGRRNMWLFDQEKDCWLQWNGEEWERVEKESVPRPSGVWAGIGTRGLKENGREAIRRLMRGREE